MGKFFDMGSCHCYFELSEVNRVSIFTPFCFLAPHCAAAFLMLTFQMLNKEHEKAEDAKPVAVPAAAGS